MEFENTGADAPPADAISVISVAPLPGEAGTDGADGVAPDGVTLSTSDLMTKDEFFIFFGGSFTTLAHVMGMVRPPKLISLERAKDMDSARPASDALYDMAESMPFMRWLISKDMGWLKGGVILFAFGAELTAAVQKELAERAPRNDDEQGEAA